MSALFRTLLELSLGAGLLAGALLAVRPLLKKRYAPRLLYWAWLLVALRLLVPLNFSLPQAPVRLHEPEFYVNLPVVFGPAQDTSAQGRGGSASAAGAAGADAAPPAPGPDSNQVSPTGPLPVVQRLVLDGWQVSALLWVVGLLTTGVILFVPHVGFLRQVRRWRTAETDPAVLAAFAAAGSALDMPLPPLYRCPAVCSPMAVGLFRPVLLLPAEDLPAGALASVLRHELVHVRRRDLWYKLALLLCRCLHWFNPLVHLMAWAAERDLERSCDAAAVAGQDSGFRAAYGRAILDAAQVGVQLRGSASPRLTTYFGGGKKAMLERLGSILDGEGKKRGVAVLALVVSTALGLALCVSAGGGAVHDLSEFRLELPSGVTTMGPEFGPYGPVRFYQNDVLAGGADWYEEGAADGAHLFPDRLPSNRVTGSEVIEVLDHGPAVETWSVTLEVAEGDGQHTEIHYYYQLEGQALFDLWFRLDQVDPDEAARGAASLRLGAYPAPSGRDGLSLSYLSCTDGVQWLLYRDNRLAGTAVVPGGLAWGQTAQWSPDGAWACVTDTVALALLSPAGDGLGVRLNLWDADKLTFVEWTADSRLRFSYVRDADGVLESGTALYDPAAGTVSDIVPALDAVPVAVTPTGEQGGPGWVMPLPADVRPVPDEQGAILYRGEAEVGKVRWTTLTGEQRNGRTGLISITAKDALLNCVLPVEGDWAYVLSLSMDALPQDLCYAMAKAFTVDGVPRYALIMPRQWEVSQRGPVALTAVPSAQGAAPESVTLNWTNYGRTEVTCGNPFHLERMEEGLWTRVVPPQDPAFSMVAYRLPAGATRAHTYYLSDTYGALPSGEYRIAASCHMPDTTAPNGRYREYPVYGTFEVS